MSHESQPSASFVSVVRKLCPRPLAIADDESRITAEHVICFRGTQTVPVAARNERLTSPQRIITQIIRDISRCPHEPVGSKFYCPYFYLPRDGGTCLSLSPVVTFGALSCVILCHSANRMPLRSDVSWPH